MQRQRDREMGRIGVHEVKVTKINKMIKKT